ncbi:MAG: cysteine desulfurase NifS [Oscillospiraceae bacterium]|nr:cysteine desulfurase NifS [Oscillospiraceae bacterium]
MFVYADNAATTKTSKTAINAMLPMLEEFYGNPSSLHTPGQLAKEKLEQARETMAKYLNAFPSEIYFTSGGSEADNQAILTAAAAGERRGRKHIISTKFEHHAVLHTLDKLKERGFEITLLDVGENGIVKLEDIDAAIREDTALVTIMFANNEIGTIQPIAEIGKLCHRHGVCFHTDAVQAAGHIPIDVKAMNIDMLSLSAHKFHGPRGVGVFFARRGVRIENLINGGAQERGKRAGTENLPAIAGMAAAFAESCESMEKNAAKLIPMRDKLIRELSKIPFSIVNGDLENRLPGNVNMCFEGIEGESLLLLLDEAGIAASSGSACTSGSLDPSHVLLAIGLPHEIAHGSLRLSISEETTEEEIDYIIETVPKIVEYLRNMSPVWEDLENGTREHLVCKKGA